MGANGLVSIRSDRSVADTTAAIRAEAERRGATVAAVVDHAAAARAAGQSKPDTQVIIFGNARAGTPAMLAVPDIAIDLPLRMLVSDDGGPGSLITWQEPGFVAVRYGLAGDQAAFLNVPAAIAQAVTAH
jgi:uncharacterized protein (DUF302 family)